MAIIKCPECGHQISDKAPICPSCGVEIAGKITKCPNCGEVYFSEMEMCPNCHSVTTSSRSGIPATTPPPIPPTTTIPPLPPTHSEEKPKKKNYAPIIFALIFAVVVCGVMYYFYDKANKNKEQEAYEYAMRSSDPTVLQSYLDTYPNADEVHRDSINAHIDRLKKVESDWTNALVSGSKSALEDYLKKYPDSPHKQDIWNKIDSIDWLQASNSDNVEAYQDYLNAHPDGNHREEAENAMKKAQGRDLQPDEKQAISTLFRQFFQSINSRNEDQLTSTCEDIMSSLLGKPSATHADVIVFLKKLYKADIVSMTWRINDDYQITKREVGVDDYEYNVQFTALQDVDHVDGSQAQNKFKVNALVSPDIKISEFNLTKLNE